MKRVFAMLFVMAILLTGCGGANTQKSEKENDGSLNVDKKISSVTITLPAFLVEGEDAVVSVEKMISEGRVTSTVVNEDGSVTMKMTKAKHNEMMAEMKKAAIETVDEMKNKGNYKSIKDIKYGEDFKEYTLGVIQADYESNFDKVATLSLGLMGYIYQIYDGIPQEQVKVTFNIKNHETGELIDTIVYPYVNETEESE